MTFKCVIELNFSSHRPLSRFFPLSFTPLIYQAVRTVYGNSDNGHMRIESQNGMPKESSYKINQTTRRGMKASNRVSYSQMLFNSKGSRRLGIWTRLACLE
uniref:Uncharacterized protein n=1 Tax=Tanacetum cinerariifolium TaxID=118510 RepID=A0A6L2P2A9_TANCI|nr:hypothetical protein [Tanacetum cinerariifolium]